MVSPISWYRKTKSLFLVDIIRRRQEVDAITQFLETYLSLDCIRRVI